MLGTNSLTTSPDKLVVDLRGKKIIGSDNNEITLSDMFGVSNKKRDMKSAKKAGMFDKSPALTLNRDKSPIPKGASS